MMAEWRLGQWEERFDAYNGAPYWVQKDTGNVRTSCPTLEEFVPDGFQVGSSRRQR